MNSDDSKQTSLEKLVNDARQVINKARFNTINVIERQILSKKTVLILRWLLVGLIICNLLFIVLMVYNQFRDRSEPVLGPTGTFYHLLFAVSSLWFALGILLKLSETDRFYQYALFSLIPLVSLFIDFIILSYYFIVILGPSNGIHNWESVTLYSVSLYRFIAYIQIFALLCYADYQKFDMNTSEKQD